ncbi:MAG: hypothetical protein V1833_06305 [Elusimicrobiota bacterium]
MSPDKIPLLINKSTSDTEDNGRKKIPVNGIAKLDIKKRNEKDVNRKIFFISDI